MDAFEELVTDLLWQEGNWVQSSVKVNLTKAEKVQIGRNTSPRWELDVAAYSGRDNMLRVFECKSFLNSTGVTMGNFEPKRGKGKDRYKLFNEPVLREVVLSRLRKQFAENGLCPSDVKIKLCMAAGKIAGGENLERIQNHFRTQGREFWGPDTIREHLHRLSKTGYENRVSAIVTKLLLN